MEENEERNFKLVLVGKIGVFIGVFLSLSFLFIPAEIVSYRSSGLETVILDVRFYPMFTLPLTIGCLIGFFSKRPLVVLSSALIALIFIVWIWISMFYLSENNRVVYVVIDGGFYMVVSGFIVAILSSLLILFITGIGRRLLFHTVLLNLFMVPMFFALILNDDINIWLPLVAERSEFLIFVFAAGLSLMFAASTAYYFHIKNESLTENAFSLSLNLIVWALVSFSVSIGVFMFSRSGSCAGAWTTLMIGPLALGFLSLWLGTSYGFAFLLQKLYDGE